MNFTIFALSGHIWVWKKDKILEVILKGKGIISYAIIVDMKLDFLVN